MGNQTKRDVEMCKRNNEENLEHVEGQDKQNHIKSNIQAVD